MAKRNRRPGEQPPAREPATVAYLRVSTAGQETEKNRADVLVFAHERGFGRVEFVEEVVSSRVHWRERAVGALVARLRAGDRLVTPELSRLGRSLLENMELLAVLKEKGVAVYDLKNRWELNGDLQSAVMAFAFSIAAQIERDLISARTKEGLRAARAKGKLIGRPRGPGKSKLDKHREDILEDLRRGVPKTRIGRRYGSSVTNLDTWLAKRGLSPEAASGAGSGRQQGGAPERRALPPLRRCGGGKKREEEA